jgi:hypothetical protein
MGFFIFWRRVWFVLCAGPFDNAEVVFIDFSRRFIRRVYNKGVWRNRREKLSEGIFAKRVRLLQELRARNMDNGNNVCCGRDRILYEKQGRQIGSWADGAIYI